MAFHFPCLVVQEQGMGALAAFCVGNDQNVRSICLNHGVSQIVETMAAHPQSELCHQYGCRAIMLMYERPLEQRVLVTQSTRLPISHNQPSMGYGITRDGGLDISLTPALLAHSLIKVV